jgi:hypothetical protein
LNEELVQVSIVKLRVNGPHVTSRADDLTNKDMLANSGNDMSSGVWSNAVVPLQSCETAAFEQFSLAIVPEDKAQ